MMVMEMSGASLGSRAPGRNWRAVSALVMCLAQASLLISVLLLAEHANYLAVIDPRSATSGAQPPGPADWFLAVNLGLVLVGLVAVAGLPSFRRDVHGVTGAVSQAIGGLNVIGATLAGRSFMDGLYFFRPEYTCTYASCWPMRQQSEVLAVPMIVTGIVMIGASLLVRRFAWWIRALAPAATWVALLLLQHHLWYSRLLPIFERPPT